MFWKPFRFLVQRLCPKAMYAAAKILGDMLFHIAVSKRMRLTNELDALSRHIPGLNHSQRTVKDAFRVWVCSELEVLVFPIMNERNIFSYVSYSGLEHLDRALAQNKGVMLLFAHFGANQMIMPAIGYRGYAMSQLLAPATVWKEKLPGKRFTQMESDALAFRWEHERSLPVKQISIFGSIKGIFTCIRNNEILGMAIDGGGGRDRSTVRFLGRTAWFSNGAMEITQKTGCVVLPTFMVRQPNGKSLMIIEPPMDMTVECSGTEELKRRIQWFVQRLETYIVTYPDHYLHFLALRSFMQEQGDSPFFV